MASFDPALRARRRGFGLVAFSVALLMLAATIGADLHAHPPHAAPMHGTSLRADDEDVTASCPICRLAHQVSSVAIAPPATGRPAAPEQVAATLRPSATSTGIEPSCSPRAPPRSTSC
jgi:hypothetical protein